MGGIGYGEVMHKSLYTLPLIAFIGIFNPMLHREPVLYAGTIAISRGWVEFIAILLRGLFTVQMVIVLIMTTGFYKVCRGLNRIGVPAVFTTQMLLVYRYIYVLVDEAIDMDRARKSRSYGKKGYRLRMWGHIRRAVAYTHRKPRTAHTYGHAVARIHRRDTFGSPHRMA